MENVPSFAEVSNIAGVYINMDTSKENVINVHIQDGRIIHFKAFVEVLFYTNLYDPSMITNPTNFSGNTYYLLSTGFKNSNFLLILKLKEQGKF